MPQSRLSLIVVERIAFVCALVAVFTMTVGNRREIPALQIPAILLLLGAAVVAFKAQQRLKSHAEAPSTEELRLRFRLSILQTVVVWLLFFGIALFSQTPLAWAFCAVVAVVSGVQLLREKRAQI